jgi:hypothetical protein
MAADAVTENMTMENAKAGAKYCTVDNAKKGYEGYQYADKKADEYGIDKEAVAKKAGNAALKAGKWAWEGLKSVDYSKLYNDTKEIGGSIYDANKKEQDAKK